MLHPVILSGGAGERLWPASTPGRPKPFLPLTGGETTFAGALARAGALPAAGPVTVVSGRRHEAAVRAGLAGQDAVVILEPEPRNTAPAMTAAALVLAARDPDAVLLFLPADHLTPDDEVFAMLKPSWPDDCRIGMPIRPIVAGEGATAGTQPPAKVWLQRREGIGHLCKRRRSRARCRERVIQIPTDRQTRAVIRGGARPLRLQRRVDPADRALGLKPEFFCAEDLRDARQELLQQGMSG